MSDSYLNMTKFAEKKAKLVEIIQLGIQEFNKDYPINVTGIDLEIMEHTGYQGITTMVITNIKVKTNIDEIAP